MQTPSVNADRDRELPSAWPRCLATVASLARAGRPTRHEAVGAADG